MKNINLTIIVDNDELANALLVVLRNMKDVVSVSMSPIPEAQAREIRDKRDIELINANADRINAGAEENLEFQADVGADKE
jgi:hypothetical protein